MCGKGREASMAAADKGKGEMDEQKNTFSCKITIGLNVITLLVNMQKSPSVQKNRVTSSNRRELNLWQAKTKGRSVCGIEITLLLP